MAKAVEARNFPYILKGVQEYPPKNYSNEKLHVFFLCVCVIYNGTQTF